MPRPLDAPDPAFVRCGIWSASRCDYPWGRPRHAGRDVYSQLHSRHGLAPAHANALETLRAGSAGAVYNFWYGLGFSVKGFVHSVEPATGTRVPEKHSGRRREDPAFLVSDASHARDSMGWRPQFVGLDQKVSSALHGDRLSTPQAQRNPRGPVIA